MSRFTRLLLLLAAVSLLFAQNSFARNARFGFSLGSSYVPDWKRLSPQGSFYTVSGLYGEIELEASVTFRMRVGEENRIYYYDEFLGPHGRVTSSMRKEYGYELLVQMVPMLPVSRNVFLLAGTGVLIRDHSIHYEPLLDPRVTKDWPLEFYPQDIPAVMGVFGFAWRPHKKVLVSTRMQITNLYKPGYQLSITYIVGNLPNVRIW